MLLRFAVLKTDADSGHASGILVAAHTLRDEGNLSKEEHRELITLLRWFNQTLTIPSILNDREHRRAISWFKHAAAAAIQRMWELKRVLEMHGHYVEIFRTTQPGTVVYEDEWQIVAKPPKGVRF